MLTPSQRALLDTSYPRFSTHEMAARRAAVDREMSHARVDALVLYGLAQFGPPVTWLTQWPVTAEAGVLVIPGKPLKLFVEHFNHLPLARRLAVGCDVHWGRRNLVATMASHLGVSDRRLGICGPLPFFKLEALKLCYGHLVDFQTNYTQLRWVKSSEELAWLRVGAALTDAGMAALGTELTAGLSETELGSVVASAYVPWGGRTGIHYFGVTSMAAPDLCVPAQFPSRRMLRKGDVITAELSASFWGYAGQVLRTFTLDTGATALYESLHRVATEAFDAIVSILRPGLHVADIVKASALIEKAGYTTCDDLVHGYGGGYLSPVLGSKSRPAGPMPDMTLRKGMVLVVQPNVVTRDGRAGVQTGEMVEITDRGCRSFHATPRGMHRVDSAQDRVAR